LPGRLLDLGLEPGIEHVNAKNRDGDPKRVGDAVADSGAVTFHGGDDGLQGRGTGARAGEDTQRFIDRHAGKRHQRHRDATGADDAEQSRQIGF
jgi:hypothetical protein